MALVLTVAATFIASELGDKTMLAVAIGRQVGHRLSLRLVRIGSAALFAVAGVGVLLGVLLP